MLTRQCPQDDSVQFWTTLSWQFFNLLSTPTLMIPLLCVSVALPWGIKRLPYRRVWSAVSTLALLIYLLAFTPISVTAGNYFLVRSLPKDSGAPADAIVILGRGDDLRQDRADVAAKLWHAGRAPLLFASGKGDADEIAQLLEQQGVPKSAISGEPCSRTTEENARFTAADLLPHHHQRIILVTDPPHMLRSLMTFQSLGFTTVPHFSPLSERLSIQKRGLLVFREYFGLASYKIKGRFSPRSGLATARH
jgi:uncharacterized SAM-binding protein YcdF (DUF218 family)